MVQKNKMISIIVPVYNSEKYIGECIESVLNQTTSDLELILVNDGSKDDSYKICQQYAQRDSRIKVIYKKNGGVSSARYEGLKNAKGKYVAFVDNDDILLPEFLEVTEKFMDGNTDIVVIGSENILSEKIPAYIENKIRNEKKYKGQRRPEENIDFIAGVYTGLQAAEKFDSLGKVQFVKPLWGKLYRKEFLINLHLEQYAEKIPILFMEDVFATNLILINARQVKFINKTLYIQRAVLDSLSRNGRLGEFYFNQIDSYAMQYEYMKEKQLPKTIQGCLDNYDKCLERIWYKIKYDRENYPNRIWICQHVDKRYQQYYRDFQKLKVGKIRKFSMWLFMKHRGIWEWTLGAFYFNIITCYKRWKVRVYLKKKEYKYY